VSQRVYGLAAGKNKVKPYGYVNLLPPDIIYHLGCGGEIKFNDHSWHTPGYGIWSCERCDQKWTDDTLRKFSRQDLQDRFYLEHPVDPESYIIVEDTDGMVRFTRTVTYKEALQKGLKKIPDPTR
jgi:hypothetical protein